MTDSVGEILLPSQDLSADISFFTKILQFKMETIFPADDPSVAVFVGHGLRLRLVRGLEGPAAPIHLLCEDPASFAEGKTNLTAPNGSHIEIKPLNPPLVMPQTQHRFVVRRLADQAPWIIGRAGMQYRDLIPDRLGGSIIASHIRIPDGGPVPDMVHYHTVGFQLIYCYRGWVDLVYEDQGEPFRLHAGNCVIQPPEIRHRVLFASDNIEVIEIGVPAEHITTIDHEMELPTSTYNPERRFQGQKFVHHKASEATWSDFRIPGFMSQDTTIAAHTENVAGVEVVKPNGTESVTSWHTSDIHFTFVLEGSMTLRGEGQEDHDLTAGDAFVIPPLMKTNYLNPSEDLELLEVSLPADFKTTCVAERET